MPMMERKQPRSSAVLFFVSIFMVPLSIFWGVLLYQIGKDGWVDIWTMLLMVPFYLPFAFVSFWALDEWMAGRHYRKESVETMGTVVHRVYTPATGFGESRTPDECHIVVSFINGHKEELLKVDVERRFFERTSKGMTLALRYVPNQPMVALLKGENHEGYDP